MNTTSPMSALRPNAPVLENQARHHAEPVEREVAAGQRELAAGDVATFVEALLAILEGREHEQIRALVEPRLAGAECGP